MLFTVPLALLSGLLASGVAQAARPGQQVPKADCDEARKISGEAGTWAERLRHEVVPGRYIVEFDTTANLQKSGLKRGDTSAHEAIYSQLRERGVSFKINQEFLEADIFVGASISVNSAADLTTLASTDGILNIVPVRKVYLGDDQPAAPSWPSTYGNSTLTRRADNATPSPAARRVSGFSPLKQIGADRVQANGPRGKGIKVGIIDGGIDYTNPVLGGCFSGCNNKKGCKVAGGYDFVGDAFSGPEDPVPDCDPLDKKGSGNHGSTVAGIIAAASDNEYNLPGVVPDASIYAYRAYGASGGYSTEDILMKAMIRAYQDDVDVLSMSFGLVSGWSSSPIAVVADRLVKRGVIVVASGGNEVTPGYFYAQAPASGQGVISTGAYNNQILAAHNATISTGYGPIPYYNYKPFADGTAGVVVPTDQTGCAVDRTKDYTGKIVVVREGGCSVSQKAQIALLVNKARGIFFVPAQAGQEPPYNNFPLIDNAYVSKADGEYLIANAASVTLTLGWNPAPQPNVYSGGQASPFNKVGPTNDLFMSTTVMAPGTKIIGVTPINATANLNGWWITDGSSFAAPYAAGAAALYLSARGNNVKPSTVREALEFSSNPLTVSKSDNSVLNVVFQGAGGIQAYDAIYTPTVIYPTELLLNDTTNFQNVQYVTVYNSGNDRKQYTIKNVPAGTVSALNPSNNFTNFAPFSQYSAPATVKISDDSFSLKKGASKLLKLTFTYPTNADPKSLPIVSGFIQVSSSGEELTIPYLGVAQSMKNVPVFDSTDQIYGEGFKLPLTADGNTGSPFETPNPVFTFEEGSFSYPVLFYRYAGGSPVVYLDLVRADANLGFTPNFNKRDIVGDVALTPEFDVLPFKGDGWKPPYVARKVSSDDGNDRPLTGLQRLICKLTNNRFSFCNVQSSFSKVPVVGNLFEQRLIVRTNSYDPNADATVNTYTMSQPEFANKTRIPNGSYKFLLRGLHISGNPDSQADYETYVGPAFTIQAAAAAA